MKGRPPVFRAFAGELVVDNFAGGGGASTGIEDAIGRPVDFAINHDPEAIAMHRANHPETRHYCQDIYTVDPREACAGRPVGLAWFSPDCTHHSRAKGGKPREKKIRDLAWVVVNWAKAVHPRVICLENVDEFQDWGPLLDDNRPDPGRAGETFRAWLAEIAALGYAIEFRSLVAADHGVPTTRKRFYMVARADGAGIAWPAATHGKGRPAAWRAAAEIIDWSQPCPSIFDRPRLLAEATQRRIAEGIRRFVIEAAAPFVIPVTHQGDARVHSIADPLRTVTAAHRGELALVAPTMIQTSYGERRGQRPRYLDLHKPLGTVVAGGQKHGLVAAFLAKHYGGGPNGVQTPGQPMSRPMGTVTAVDHHALTTAFLTKFQQNSVGQHLSEPLHTVMAGATRFAEVRAFLLKYYSAPTSQQQGLFDPLHTVTAKARFGLVVIGGEQYQIADIGMRMLQPHELYAAQGFPSDYDIAPTVNGKPLTKTAQIRCAGNSVCPPVAEALVRAQVGQGDARRAA